MVEYFGFIVWRAILRIGPEFQPDRIALTAVSREQERVGQHLEHFSRFTAVRVNLASVLPSEMGIVHQRFQVVAGRARFFFRRPVPVD